MIKVLFVSTDSPFEVQGMFLDDKLIGSWCLNDGRWRGEYFNKFMRELGIEIIRSNDKTLKRRLIEAYDTSIYEDDEII